MTGEVWKAMLLSMANGAQPPGGNGGGFGGFPGFPEQGEPVDLGLGGFPGMPPQQAPESRGPQPSPAARTAVRLGLFSLGFWCLGPFAIIAGVLAQDEIKGNRGRYTGKGAAFAAIVLGAFSTTLMIVGAIGYFAWGPAIQPRLQRWFSDQAPQGTLAEMSTPKPFDEPLPTVRPDIDPIEAEISVRGAEHGMPVIRIFGSIPDGTRLQLVLRCDGAAKSMVAAAVATNAVAEFGPLTNDHVRFADGMCRGWVRIDPEEQSATLMKMFGSRGEGIQGTNVLIEDGVRIWQSNIEFRVGEMDNSNTARAERGGLAKHYLIFKELRDDLHQTLRLADERGVHGNDDRWVEFSAQWNKRRQRAIEDFQKSFGLNPGEYGGNQAEAWEAVRDLGMAVYREWEVEDGRLSDLGTLTTPKEARAQADQAFARAEAALDLKK